MDRQNSQGKLSDTHTAQKIEIRRFMQKSN